MSESIKEPEKLILEENTVPTKELNAEEALQSIETLEDNLDNRTALNESIENQGEQVEHQIENKTTAEEVNKEDFESLFEERLLELEQQNEKLNQREQEITARLLDIDNYTVKLNEKEQELQKRENDMKVRELNAENGFAEQHALSVVILEQKQQCLRDEVEQIEKDYVHQLAVKRKAIDEVIIQMQQEAIEEQKTQHEQMKRLRQERLAALNAEYEDVKATYDQELMELKKKGEMQIQTQKLEAENIIAQAQQMKEAVTSELNKLNSERELLQNEKLKVRQQQEDLEFQKQYLEEKKNNQDREIERRVEERIGRVYEDLAHYKKLSNDYKEGITELNQYKAKKELEESRTAGRTEQDLLQQIDTYKRKNETLERELALRPDASDLEELKVRAAHYDELLEEKRELRNKLESKENEIHSYRIANLNHENAIAQLKVMQKHAQALEVRLEKYSEELDRLKALHQRPEELESRRKSIEEKFHFEWEAQSVEDIEELDWLNRISKNSKASGIELSNRLLYSFHTALKSSEYSPLTVLAGVSGTGKSELPRMYSRFGGLYFIPLSVQPDWDSPQSLFGYFNSIENRYNPTTLLKSLVQFQDVPGEGGFGIQPFKDAVLLVLLDEMNLAHVELYFSDLLSKLELRRGSDDPIALEVDLGEHKYKVNLSKNVLWVGTMNEDETTKTLSDKVIDRGNVINFPRPKEFVSRTQPKLHDKASMLHRERWNEWVNSRFDLNEETQMKYRNILQDINVALSVSGRALGHRVWQSIENYITSHPLVIANALHEDKQQLETALNFAFEEALVYKVMPKLRGLELDAGEIRRQCIDKIGVLISNYAPGIYTDFKNALENAYGIFLWRSAEYLDNEQYKQFVEKNLV